MAKKTKSKVGWGGTGKSSKGGMGEYALDALYKGKNIGFDDEEAASLSGQLFGAKAETDRASLLKELGSTAASVAAGEAVVGGGKAAIKAAKNGIDFSKGWRKATEGGRFPGIGIKAAGGEAATAAGAGGAGGIFGKVLKGAGWVGGALLLMHLIDKLYSGTVGERDKQKAGMDEREALSHSIQAQLTDQDWQSREMATQVGAYDNQRLAASGAEMGEANLSDLIRGHEDSLRAQAQMDQPSMLDLLALGRG